MFYKSNITCLWTLSQQKTRALGVQAATLFVLAFSVLLHEMVEIDNSFSLSYLSGMLVFVTIWTIYSWSMIGEDLFEPYILFFVFTVLVCAGPVYLEIFGLNRAGILDNRFSDKTIVVTVYFVLICLTSFHFGALLVHRNKEQKKDSQTNQESIVAQIDIRLVGWILLGISILPTAYLLYEQLAVTYRYGYIGSKHIQLERGLSAWHIVLSGFFVSSLLLLLAGSKNSRRLRMVLTIMLMTNSLLLLTIGNRHDALLPVIAYAWVWNRTIKRIPKKRLLLAAFIIMFIISPGVGYIRQYSEDKLGGIMEYFGKLKEGRNPVLSSIDEYGSSMQIIAYIIEMVPEEKPYDFGMNYLYSILLVVPNFLKGFDLEPEYGNLSYWLVKEVRPEIARVGGGLGFNIFAEVYCAFGWYGAPLLTFLFGMALVRFNDWASSKNDALKVATLGIFLSYLLHEARGTIGDLVRPLFWYSLGPYFMVRYIFWLRKRALHDFAGNREHRDVAS